MKSVLISIQPKWCELIASGEKTLEVRKTRPNAKIPFRCYIYQTKKKWLYKLLATLESFAWVETVIFGQGNVIGEFVCDAIVPISVNCSDVNSMVALRKFPFNCLTDKQIIDYLGNGVTGYGWHISDLKIYDNPKKLSDFTCIKTMRDGFELRLLERPPQSWCYVETLE